MGKRKYIYKERVDPIRHEIDNLIESLSFEPVNFHEVKARIGHLMGKQGKRKGVSTPS